LVKIAVSGSDWRKIAASAGGNKMWEHAAPLIGIPSAIKALFDLHDRLAGSASHQEAATAKEKLREISDAIDGFAIDALELAAYKALHSATNQFMIDLKDTFAVISPDLDRSRMHYSATLKPIKSEIKALWMGQRAGAQLAALRDNPKFMIFLNIMPREIVEVSGGTEWQEYFWHLLRSLENDVENFGNFYQHVDNTQRLNMALNTYADRRIRVGIDDFDRIMEQLRSSIKAASN
jgi:hypothetical protein